MPVYEYECTHCGHRFDIKQGFHDKPQADCPKCQKKAKRVFHASPIIFKGSGFYVTDHKSTANPASSPTKTKSEAKPEAKPETKKSKD
jgi:putative FmdB family regulatory protein